MLNKIKDLTKEQLAIGACLICLLISILAGSFYRAKANKLEITLETTSTQLRIERNKAKLVGNLKERLQLQDALDKITKDYALLYKKYDVLLESDTTYTEVMNELGEINNNQDVCSAWLRLYGIRMCED